MTSDMNRRVAMVAVLSAIVGGLTVFISDGDERRLTAEFPSTISLFAGAKVKVLGVDVGEVTDIDLRDTSVLVEITYDSEVELPADVRAVTVPPSIVGDRFIQLTPAYSSGPTLPDGADLGLDRTAVPVELDDTYRTVDQLVSALGPRGANSDGALSRLIRASAHQMGGNGKRFNETMKHFAAALGTFSDSREDIAGTITNFGRLSRRFASDDGTIRSLIRNLTLVSTQLNGQRDEIGLATENLAVALDELSHFIATHKSAFTDNIKGLANVTRTLSRHTRDLAELVDVAPLGMTNFMNIYQPTNWDFDNPGAVHPEGRTGVLAMRTPADSNFALQIGYAMTTVCARLSPEDKTRMAPLCEALASAGGDLGAIAADLLAGSGNSEPATSLPELLLGGQPS